jgi:hypothetical protein
MLGKDYRPFSSSLCNFLHSPVTSSLLGPKFSSAPYSQTPSAYVPPSMSATKFHTHTERRAKSVLESEIENIVFIVSHTTIIFLKKRARKLKIHQVPQRIWSTAIQKRIHTFDCHHHYTSAVWNLVFSKRKQN